MAKITSRTILDQLRNELKSRGVSRREVQRLLGGVPFRHKLQAGNEELISVDDLLRVLEVAKIDKVGFFARLAGVGGLTLAMFGRPKKEHWTQRQRRVLQEVGKVEDRGAGGYAEVRAELRNIELLRDEDPQAAEAAAWKFLEEHRTPGALVGGLAVLAVEAPRSNALRLFSMALELLGPDLRSAAGGKLATAIGRNLFLSGNFHEGSQVLENHALPVISLFGTLEELALLSYYIGKCASSLGEFAVSRAAFERTLEIGSERLQFATLQHLAVEELNVGNLQKAAEMYSELTAMPYFDQAENRAKAFVTWSKLTAQFLAGQLGPAAELEFRSAIDEARILDLPNQVAAVLDLALYLMSIGKDDSARELLEAEQWNVLDLEDGEIPRKFIRVWEALELPSETWEHSCLAGRSPTAPGLALRSVPDG